jgi:hypothetical protein
MFLLMTISLLHHFLLAETNWSVRFDCRHAQSHSNTKWSCHPRLQSVWEREKKISTSCTIKESFRTYSVIEHLKTSLNIIFHLINILSFSCFFVNKCDQQNKMQKINLWLTIKQSRLNYMKLFISTRMTF